MNLNNLVKELKNVMDDAPASFSSQQTEALSNVTGEARIFMLDAIAKMNKLVREGDKKGLENLMKEVGNKK
jgi:hypothetical protein